MAEGFMAYKMGNYVMIHDDPWRIPMGRLYIYLYTDQQ